MKIYLCLFVCAVFAVSAWGDELTKAVQQRLKDQGFFYGEATGQPGSETDAALRRYQIRYGLKVTGGLNDETMRSLGLKLSDFQPPQNAVRHENENKPPAPANSPKPERSAPQALPPRPIPSPTPKLRQATPRPTPSVTEPKEKQQKPIYRTPQPPEEGPNQPTPENQPPSEGYREAPPGNEPPSEGYAPRRHYTGRSNYGGIFAGSLYTRAPERVKSHVLAAVQDELGRHGLYRGEVDGQPSQETSQAIARFQEMRGLAPTGHLDTRTLSALRALPGQENGPRVRRVYRAYGPWGPYGPRPYGPYYGPYGPYARNGPWMQ